MADPESLTPQEWAFWERWMRAQRLLVQEVDRVLQQDFGISKSDFSVLMTLDGAPDGSMRVSEVAQTLGWEKSRVAHQLTRMERRGLVSRSESGAAGRRTSVELTTAGRTALTEAIDGHGRTVRRLGLDLVSPKQAAAISAWSERLIEELERPQ